MSCSVFLPVQSLKEVLTCKKQSLQSAFIHNDALYDAGNISEDVKFISPGSDGIIVLETW
jgi:hypothetical protein